MITKKTRDLSIFKKHEKNRKIDPNNLKKIISSIQARNLLDMRPILVDSELRVKDGQHRLEAAKILGIEICYQIQEDVSDEDMILLNVNQASWSREDFLNYYENSGSVEYLKLREFCDKNGMRANDAINLFSKFSRVDGKKSLKFKKGEFKFPNPDEISKIEENLKKTDEIVDLMNNLSIAKQHFLSSKRIKEAIYRIVANELVDFNKLKKKISIKFDSIRLAASVEAYYHLLKDIYNWRNEDPI